MLYPNFKKRLTEGRYGVDFKDAPGGKRVAELELDALVISIKEVNKRSAVILVETKYQGEIIQKLGEFKVFVGDTLYINRCDGTKLTSVITID